ncbi:hypothetical protein [Stenotrophomonas acidaminiphila]|jgi:hypothetical protein
MSNDNYIDIAGKAIRLTNEGAAATLQDAAAASDVRHQQADAVRADIASNRFVRASSEAVQLTIDLNQAKFEIQDLKKALQAKTQELNDKTRELAMQTARTKTLLEYAAFVSCEKNAWLNSIDTLNRRLKEESVSLNLSDEINKIYDSEAGKFASTNKQKMEMIVIQKKLSFYD